MARKDGEHTRSKILEAACEVFGEKGFRGATHAEICRRSGVNTALINYHFRSKEILYVEAWSLAFSKSLEAHPVDGGVPDSAPAEERLRGRIFSIVSRVMDEDNKVFNIVHREMAAPTGLLSKVIHETIDPLRQDMERIIRELLGAKASEKDVHLCMMSMMSQCFHPSERRHRHKLMKKNPQGGHCVKIFDFSVQELAEHISDFSIAGIKATRKKTES